MTLVPDGFPKPRAPHRPREKTDDPSVRNRRNREYGAKKQAVVRRFFEQLTGTRARFAGRKVHEESWSHLPVRIEVKSGQQVGPAATAYLSQERQSDQSKAFGDTRPFVGVCAPEGMSDFLITMRGSKLHETLEALGYYRANETGGL